MPAGNWFTIVATDLFAGAFASIMIIDAATPKNPIVQSEPVILRMEYNGGNLGDGLDCRDPDNVYFSFTDDQGEAFFSRDANMSGSREEQTCVAIGLLENVSLGTEPDDAFMLVAYRPSNLDPIGTVKVQLGQFSFECKEGMLC